MTHSRINIGCGQTPTPQYKNFDCSFSVRLASRPLTYRSLKTLGLLKPEQIAYIEFLRRADIRWANATKCIPERDCGAEVVYASHMLEHLSHREARGFLAEALRVLRPGGRIRLAVPDIAFHVNNYMNHRSADQLMSDLRVCKEFTSLASRLQLVLLGSRHHLWMYDGMSLCRLLHECGFSNAVVVPSGETTIPEPGELNLAERAPESVFVEAVKG
jgi:SAM-dependent methyltransferase